MMIIIAFFSLSLLLLQSWADMDSVPRSCSQCLSDWVFCMNLLPPLLLLSEECEAISEREDYFSFFLSLYLLNCLFLYLCFFIFSRMKEAACFFFLYFLYFLRMGLKEGKKCQSITRWRNYYIVWRGVAPKNRWYVCYSNLGWFLQSLAVRRVSLELRRVTLEIFCQAGKMTSGSAFFQNNFFRWLVKG